MTYSRLFLHMGPGLNAYPERQLLTAKMPDTLFWDQPVITDPKDAYLSLANACLAQVESMAQENGGPIHLTAHSFGGHLATEILRRRPELIASCEFFSTGYDVPTGFFNLLKQLVSIAPDEQRQKIQDFLQANSEPSMSSREKFWECIGLIVSVPDFMSLYWPSRKQYEGYLHISSQGPVLDFATFKNVLDDFIFIHMMRFSKVSWKGPVKIHFGDKDPLLLLENEKVLWKKILPQAEIQIHSNSGHYTHLEKELE